MRNRIFGAIGILWGGGIILRWFLTDSSSNSAYQTGQNGAVVFGLIMLAAGVYYVLKKPGE